MDKEIVELKMPRKEFLKAFISKEEVAKAIDKVLIEDYKKTLEEFKIELKQKLGIK